MPKTTTPVEAAEQQLADAAQACTEATRALAALKTKILTYGAQAVTAQELADATARVEHARLGSEHATRTLTTARADERQQQLEQLKAAILDEAGNPDDALAAMRQIEELAAQIIATCVARQRNIARWTAAMRQADVPQAAGQQTVEGHAGLGWSPAGMGRSDSVTVDGRRIDYLNPGAVIAAALARAARTAGARSAHLAPFVTIAPLKGSVDNPEQWIHTRY